MSSTTSIFGIEESSRFANALADSNGIKVVQEDGAIVPFTDTRGGIHIGIPNIYNHEEYMSSLHREIGKQVEPMSYFRKVKLEEGSLQDVCKDLIQTEVTERFRSGTYEGRDRILQQQYHENIQSNGGISTVIKALAEVNPTIGAVMYLNNEIRNDWQGYEHCKPIPEIQDELERLGFLEDEWKSLETKEDLEQLLHRIEYEEPPEGGGDGDGEDDSSDDGGEPGDSGESSEGDQQDSEEGQGDSDDSEGSKDEDGSTDNPDSGGEDSESGGQPEDSKDSEEPDDGGDSGPEGDSEDTPEEDGPEGSKDHGIGACEGASKLKDMGLVKKPMKADEAYYEEGEKRHTYIPDDDVDELEVSKMGVSPPEAEHEWQRGSKAEAVRTTLGSFSLSRKIKKYLLTMKQTGWDRGQTRGKLSGKDCHKLYCGALKPAVFKVRQASKIQQDTAIFLLGDCSGSMSGSKYLTSAAAQIATSEVLQALKIPHMMMQFTSSRSRIHYIMKNFSERFVSRDTMIERYGHGDITMGCNADGEAVTRAAQILAQRPEKQKILIVLSDGSPAYGNGNDSQYLKDTVASIEGSRQMDIIGIGLMDDNVERYYKSSKVIHRIEDLEPVLIGLLKQKVLK
jgi:cobaltochelatase CobT